ncbi:MAG TPA: NADP transhydrogenase subunit beta [Firmicutes bacterium]|nr:NADP transhydrogenase subunit beta [Bacillota bacterium]
MLYLQILFILGFIYGIRLMSSPKTAVRGNLLGALSMLGAIIVTLIAESILTVSLLWVALLVGTVLGIYMAQKVLMIQMPQMVALLNGFGGGASALVALMAVFDALGGAAPLNSFTWFTTGLAIIVGGVTFSGSLVAAGKLHGAMSQRPVHYKRHNLYVWAALIIMAVEVFRLTYNAATPMLSAVILLAVSLFFGVVFTIRVGGADMPITISLLNSFSGVAGAVAGFALYNTLLVTVGAVVGASGLILTQIMCRAMNRSLMQILLGQTTVAKKAPAAVKEKPAGEKREEPPKVGWQESLRQARSVAIIPGYGMAVAQAQLQVKQLAENLQARGVDVRFGIHPVAGRMPGHMNVLLAEVDVPYDQLYELEDINEFLETADLAIIVGANDVVNPAAIESAGTPIYGMPIIRADSASEIIICNYDTEPGYAGIANRLYEMEKAHLVLGDAKDSLAELLKALAETEKPAAAPETAAGPVELLAKAKRVVIVPGYGMAVAQAQGQVKRLIELLQRRDISVQIAVHPVAGRMPGHMNVLLAEVDVPYDLMYDMDQINDDFADVDVVIVVGANDVINPAAITEKDTPIYGMPILHVDRAAHVLIYNLDREPGYSGVPNALYDAKHCVFIAGDAAQTVGDLTQSLAASS